jgi:hypothetical protein
MPCSLLKVNRCFGGTIASIFRVKEAKQEQNLPPAFTLVSCSAYSSTPKMEAICSSETVDFQWITQRYIPEDSTLHNHCCEDLKSYIWMSANISNITDKHLHIHSSNNHSYIFINSIHITINISTLRSIVLTVSHNENEFGPVEIKIRMVKWLRVTTYH